MAANTITTRSVRPADIVVPLDEIIQRLSDKLSQTDIDSLIASILAQRTDIVRPGDLITANLMNQILTDVAGLKRDVLVLEAGIGGPEKHVVITRPLPGEQFKVGQQMEVAGRNFGFSNGTLVLHIDDRRVTSFKTGSNDELLIFTVPELSPEVLPGGRSALLTVANDRSSANRMIRLLSARDLEGAIDVIFMSVDPADVPLGSTPLFLFNLHSRANYDASFTVRPIVSGVANPADWNASLDVLDPDTGKPIPHDTVLVPEGSDTEVAVRLKIPQVPDNTPFRLSVGAESGPVSGTSGPLRVVVGIGLELPDPNTSLSFDKAAFQPNGGGLVISDPEEDTIQVNSGALAVVWLDAKFKAVGVYDASIAAVNEGDIKTENWTLNRHPQDPEGPYRITAEDLDNSEKMTSRSPRFVISPSTDPQHPASPTGECEFELQLRGSNTSRTLRMRLSLGS